jgi:hypothetical protein
MQLNQLVPIWDFKKLKNKKMRSNLTERDLNRIVKKVISEDKDESMVKKLMRKLKGVSDEQLNYNVKNDLPWDWKGSKEGYYEKMENKRHHSGSN